MKAISLSLPLSPEILSNLNIGDKVLLSGTIYTARDQAHIRLVKILDEGKPNPIPFADSAIFYCGPSPTPLGSISGAIGPTTSTRMDKYTPPLLEQGLKVMIGKGGRSPEVEQSIRDHGALYLICVGGASALLTRCVVSRETFLWADLDSEAIYKLVVQDFPCYVAVV